MVDEEKYPESWAKPHQLESQKCPTFEGQYEDLSDTANAAQKQMSLSAFLMGVNTSIEERCPRRIVQIRQPDSFTITFELQKNELTVKRGALRMELGEFFCKKNAIVIRSETDGYVSGYTSFSGKLSHALLVANDGSLVGKESMQVFGMNFVVPVYGSHQEWHRWKRVPPGTARCP